MSRMRLVVSALLGLALVGAGVSTASATHSWGGYHWARTSNPFTLTLGDNLTSTLTANWDTHLGTASTDWSASPVLDTTIAAGVTNGKKCAASTGTVQVCNAAYGRRGWLGIATIWISGGHITKGTVKVNDSYFGAAPYNTDAWRNVVMCQEIGHTLGLDHQDEDFGNADLNTCMDYSNNPEPNQHPNTHDYQMLDSIYAHLDSTTTVGAATPGGSGARVGNSPRSWGTEVEGSREHGSSTYVKSLRNGHRAVTHVIWVR